MQRDQLYVVVFFYFIFRLGYCFTPYQRLWLYNGAPLVAFYDTLGYGGRIIDLNPRRPHGDISYLKQIEICYASVSNKDTKKN